MLLLLSFGQFLIKNPIVPAISDCTVQLQTQIPPIISVIDICSMQGQLYISVRFT